MHSTIFVIDCDISEPELWESVKSFNGGIDYINEEKEDGFYGSLEWLERYLSSANIKVSRQENYFRIDKESYLDHVLSEKKRIIEELNSKLYVAKDSEEELRQYRSAGYSLYVDPRYGFLFYSETSWLVDFDQLCEFENEKGEIEFEVTKTFDYHS